MFVNVLKCLLSVNVSVPKVFEQPVYNMMDLYLSTYRF